ncbi:hypothetical protein [Zymobacter sp. IVIA_12111.31 C1]
MKISKKFIESMSLKQLEEYIYERIRTNTAKEAFELLVKRGVNKNEK